MLNAIPMPMLLPPPALVPAGAAVDTERVQSLERELYRLIIADLYLWKGQPSKSPRFARREEIVATLHAICPYQQPRAPEPLPAFDAEGMDRARFMEVTQGLTRPVIIRGFGRDMRATRYWTPDYLRERLAGKTCAAVVYDEETRLRSWDRDLKFVEMDFSEYLTRMVHEDIYINNRTELVESCPALLADLELDRIHTTFTDPSSRWDELVTTNFFIGARRVHSSVHAAFGGNFFLNIVGRKRWLMIDPCYSAYIHPIPAQPFQYVRAGCGGYRRCAEQGQHDNIFVRLPHFEAVLEPGDLLYNTPWFWHEVENLEDFTVGCAVRHFPTPLRASPSWSNHPLFTLTSLYPRSRALMFGHWLRHRLTGNDEPLRNIANKLMIKRLYQSFRR
jgi:Cupin-like domain